MTPSRYAGPQVGAGLALTRLTLATWATEVVIAQKLAEAVWQPYNRYIPLPEGMNVV